MAIVIPDTDAAKKAKAIFSGTDFGRALCEHFGLPAGQVLKVAPHADRDEIMHAKVEIALTPEDLAGIAALVGGAKAPEAPRLDRLPVVSMGMDTASGPDQTVMAVAGHGTQVKVANHLTQAAEPEAIMASVRAIGERNAGPR